MKNQNWLKLFSLNILVLTAFGCNRASPTSASINLNFPTTNQFQKALSQKTELSRQSSPLNYSLMCFVVNIKSPQIPTTAATSCDIERGMIAGSVGPGKNISMDNVPIGASTTVEIYGLMRVTDSDPCPTDEQSKWNWPMNRIYFLGQTENVTVVAPSTDIEVSLTLPASTQNIAVQNAWANSCQFIGVAPIEPTKGRIQWNARVLSGANFKAYSRVSDRNDLKPLKGSNFQIRNWRASND